MQMYFEFVGEGSHRLIFPLKITQNMHNWSIDFDNIKNDDPGVNKMQTLFGMYHNLQTVLYQS